MRASEPPFPQAYGSVDEPPVPGCRLVAAWSTGVRRTDRVSNGQRFLTAFAAIEDVLRHRAGAPAGERFLALVGSVAANDRAVGRFAVDLKEFADLPNAIVHDRGGGYLIADPHDSTVSRIESILTLISRPPRLDSLFPGPVASASPAQQVGAAAQLMRSGD
ncbi:MAG: hypothetical protein ACRDKW_14785 [Actinomycetota bacterium]